MADTTVHLVDHVFPRVPVRQWVLSVPRRVRYWLARRGKLRRRMLAIMIDVIEKWMKRRIGRGDGRLGAVTCIQRFGGSLNLNYHFHSLVMDGLYVRSATGGAPVFLPVPAPEIDDLFDIAERVQHRAVNLLWREGLISDTEYDRDDIPDETPETLERMQSASIQGLLAFSPETMYVGRIGRDPLMPYVPFERYDVGEYEGYNIDARVRIEAEDREGLEKLCRYILRPPFSQERFEAMADGRIAYRMRHSWNDGTTHIVMTPQQLLEKLAALIPNPRQHLVIYHGVLGANAKWRSQIVAGCPEGPTKRKKKHGCCSTKWAELMKRVFKLDVLSCPNCGGRLKYIATIGTDQEDVIEKILRSMGYETQMPARAPARDPPEEGFPDLWDERWHSDSSPPVEIGVPQEDPTEYPDDEPPEEGEWISVNEFPN